MRVKLRQALSVVAVLGLLLCPAIARADATEEARRHFDRGLELVDDGQFAQAIIEFDRCYEIKPHYAVHYNIGQAYIALAKPVEAVAALRRYLGQGGKAIGAQRRASVEKEIERQEARIAQLTIRVAPAGATIRLDGRDVGRAPLPTPVRVGVGAHTIVASLTGYESAETTATLAGGDKGFVEFTLIERLRPKAAPSAPPTPPPGATSLGGAPNARTATPTPRTADAALPTEPDRGSSGNTLRTTGIVTAVTGLAGLGAGTAFWFMALSKHDEALAQHQADDDASAHQLQSDAEGLVTASNLGFIAGGALMVTGVVLYLVAPADHRARSAYELPVWPSVGSDSIGLATKGAF